MWQLGWPRGPSWLCVYKVPGHSLHQHAISDIIWHALLRVDIPGTKESMGLFRSDGNIPDGANLLPWIGGYLTWDATVVHSCAASYISYTSELAQSGPLQGRQLTVKFRSTRAFLHPICFSLWPSRLWALSTSRLWNS